jgi:serine/threonine protein kinase
MVGPSNKQSLVPAGGSMSAPYPVIEDLFTMPFQPGDVIVGKYEVIGLIGTGGVGFVVSARHVGFDERVALKFLRPEFATHPEAVARFTIEARASFKIRSEHVARVLDVDSLPDGTPFIAMELLEGTDLRSLLDRRLMLPIELAADCALETCEALAAAHAMHVIHRDIKPANLFLTGQGNATDHIKVLDFGISKVALASQTHRALTRIAVGTPPYMSPEQVRASSDLDARSDIWSLGCVLYEMLTGTAPFDRMSLMQSCAAVLEDDPVPVRDLRSVIPQELEDIVARCLQKDPGARYADIAEVAQALVPFGSGKCGGYANRCRALLNGERLARSSTPSAFPAVRPSASTLGFRTSTASRLPAVESAMRVSFVEAMPPTAAIADPISRVTALHSTDGGIAKVGARGDKTPLLRWALGVTGVLLALVATGLLLRDGREHPSAHVAATATAPKGNLQQDTRSALSEQPSPAADAKPEPFTPPPSAATPAPTPAALKSSADAKRKRVAKAAARSVASKRFSQIDEIDVGF